MGSAPTPARPRVLYVAAIVLGLESLIVILYGLIEITHIDVARLVVGAGVSVLLLGYGAVLVAVARGVARGSRWSRGPGVATQLLQALLAYSFRDGATWWVGLILGAAALVVLVCLLLPAATAVFVEQPPEEDHDRKDQ